MLMPFGGNRQYIPAAMSYLCHEDKWVDAATHAFKYLK